MIVNDGSGLRSRKTALYVAIVIVGCVATYLVKLPTVGIFGCPISGYDSDTYLSYCNTTHYGDYDHGAFWFAIEPSVTHAVAEADVLFVGSSRSQFGFSSTATREWFADRAIKHYLLGFSHTGTVQFAAPLLAKLQPKARAYVINVDRFFDDGVTQPAAEVMNDPLALASYRKKGRWQSFHRRICAAVSVVCGDNPVYFRTRADGHWVSGGAYSQGGTPVSEGEPTDQERWSRSAELAGDFLAALPVPRQCVIFTIVPYPGTQTAEARAIADAVQVEFVTPTFANLTTFDGSHLDEESAEAWSVAFLDAAADTIERCAAAQTNSGVASPTTGR